MAAAAITLSGTIFLVDSIQRIATKGTGTTIFYGSPRGGGSTLLQTDVTESLVTVVTALGDAVIPLTVVTNGVGVVNYFPLNAIKGIRASVASPINAAVLIGAPSGNGASIGEVFVTETAAQVRTLLNDANNTTAGVSSLKLGSGTAKTGDITIPVDEASFGSSEPILITKATLYDIYDNQLFQKPIFANLNWSATGIDALGRPAAYSAYLFTAGTPTATKTLNINSPLLATANWFETIDIYFNATITTLTLTSTGFTVLQATDTLAALSSTLTITSCKGIRLQYVGDYLTSTGRVLVTKLF
jgi:hypothetical protein